MLRTILHYGVIAGLVVGAAMIATHLVYKGMPPPTWGMALGYLTMLVALSAVFVGIKRHRDVDRGGVIRFWPAFGLGLGISVVASVFYVLTWEVVLVTVAPDFIDTFTNAMVETERAKGTGGAALQKTINDAQALKTMYANPLYRLPMTLSEIFPVGVLVSLVSAAVLRNPRVLPARG